MVFWVSLSNLVQVNEFRRGLNYTKLLVALNESEARKQTC